MASMKTESASRGRYSSAGYTGRQEQRLYISKVPAGSAQDNLRDLNRVGYRCERPWNDGPQPAFADGVAAATSTAMPKPRTAPRKKFGFFERVAYEARRDKKAVALCVTLCCVIVFLTAMWSGKMVDGVALARDIAMYESQIRTLETESESLIRQLETASSSERIRNLAQNELGMLRPERANQGTIYIRTGEHKPADTAQEATEPRMELLDVLLGLLDVFHIGE